MIPGSLVSLVLFAASLGPGYVYVRIAETRASRPARSTLGEAVEMVVIGGTFSLIAALAVVAGGDALGQLDSSAFGSDPRQYLFDHPACVLGALSAMLGLSYGAAAGAAHLVHRSSEAVFKPGRHVWQQAFWWGRDGTTDVTVALLELRDGRRIAGVLSTFTAEMEDNREIGLTTPIYVQASPASPMVPTDDRFLVLREADVLYVSGRYRPGT